MSKDNLNKILKALNEPHDSELEVIKVVLSNCPHKLQVSFALYCALDVEHLLVDERSTDALRAVEKFLDSGEEIPEAIVSAANAYAAHAAAYVTNAANYAAHAYAAYATVNAAYAANAASYVANAAHAANAAAYATTTTTTTTTTATTAYAANYSEARNEKMHTYLNHLKELVIKEFSRDMDEDAKWLMRVVI